MFRKLVIAVITAWASILETTADAIAATLPPPAADRPRGAGGRAREAVPAAAHRVTAKAGLRPAGSRRRTPLSRP
jgi:hypothetical protein